jgi:hypothetical protein
MHGQADDFHVASAHVEIRQEVEDVDVSEHCPPSVSWEGVDCRTGHST